ncbi:hypothetical protein Q0F97_07785 [Tetragenococcus halophilus]|uniref:hypothetical protein n=1 Tax=Tetragenococcus halophilus TaxID=51669 RepID=UPI0011AFCA1F|nr:hypothetical protein [Tetragenococcus halophilus]MDN6128730.1 hypothetical protein [Tetragenococcus halophilus]NRR75085.1 hypothetical protein [Tetragenococcus halophilus]NWN99745.1 hypothetical protein [Tetragenococcus halophilus]
MSDMIYFTKEGKLNKGAFILDEMKGSLEKEPSFYPKSREVRERSLHFDNNEGKFEKETLIYNFIFLF